MIVSHSTLIERRNRLINRIQKAGPEHFDMTYWYSIKMPERVKFIDLDAYKLLTEEQNENACGWTACFAGHGLLEIIESDNDIVESARTAVYERLVETYFGLPDNRDEFYTTYYVWPEVMKNAFNTAIGNREYSAVPYEDVKAAELYAVITYLKYLNEIEPLDEPEANDSYSSKDLATVGS